MEKQFYVYIMSNINNLYIGMTNNIIRRVYEHKNHLVKGFTDKYNVTKLVFAESTTTAESAILREKQLKKWSRKKKEWLVNKSNLTRLDLYYKLLDN